ncbi:NAD-dependent epimerase/dehydratase family protein [Streptomyces armeniacus]|uniref:NAD-dependent epimerase/dehydratase family protein n=1 Tax=Streptomyces armeniacus TaxID=83291 RepID=A0A345XXC2_9ACTN|nr:SDR family oxidoreductase [Streptomyces armeniacus]AXK36288.1 NAD-dependent epimerase/dehydratase family protein [Streptomyces armeniacus]
MSRPRTVLLTGASGVVGRAILREEHAGRLRIIPAARSAPVPEATEPVLHCDVSRERFGLDREDYRALAADVDVVIHSAGLTEWGLPAERYRPVNIDGTRHVIDFAEQAGATVHFVSTEFVAALLPDAAGTLSDGNICRNYIESKRRAEVLLEESGLPHLVFRPTNLIGHATTGWTSRGQIVQQMSDWLRRGRAPFVPVYPGIRMDFVAQDLLARAIVRAIELDDDQGTFYVSYGPEAMDVEACLRTLAKHAAGLGRTFTAPPLRDARALDPAEITGRDPMTRMYLAVLRDVGEVTWCSGGVLPTSLPELRERYGLTAIDDTAAYAASLAYAAEHLG